MSNIIFCDNPQQDYHLLNIPISLALFYKRLSNGNVQVWQYDQCAPLSLFYMAANCDECGLTLRLKLHTMDRLIVPEFEEFCKDHRHEAALDKENNGL